MEEFSPFEPLSLTDTERTLFDRIDFDFSSDNRSEIDESLKVALQLMESLLTRRAIPEIRLLYFRDPAMFTGAGRKSVQGGFEVNGTRGKEILEHPHFLPFLHYFIHGPDLSNRTVAAFCKILNEDFGTSSSLKRNLQTVVRSEVSSRISETRADIAEEFFKLCIELDIDSRTNLSAHEIREHALAVATSLRRLRSTGLR